jgi:hypothetical protein
MMSIGKWEERQFDMALQDGTANQPLMQNDVLGYINYRKRGGGSSDVSLQGCDRQVRRGSHKPQNVGSSATKKAGVNGCHEEVHNLFDFPIKLIIFC